MLIFLRHGRTEYNAEARLLGQLDSPLDSVGYEQSAELGTWLRARLHIDRVVTSDLRRTLQTAEAAGLGGLPTTVDAHWREIDFGTYDTRRIAEVIAEMTDAWGRDPRYEPPGGESLAAMHDRVGVALAQLLAGAGDDTVAVVTHATPVKSVVSHVLGGDAGTILRLQINLASATTVRTEGQAVLLAGFNERPR